MNIKTYRARTMRDALELVRLELGPSAAVLHTRELNSGIVKRLLFGRQYEVAASAAVNVPSRLPAAVQFGTDGCEVSGVGNHPTISHTRQPTPMTVPEAHLEVDYRSQYRDDFRTQVAGQLDELHAMVE
jgi:flagellar biosynthesis GTPase FlhF